MGSSLAHQSVSGSDTICNSPNPPLVNIVRFCPLRIVINLTGLKCVYSGIVCSPLQLIFSNKFCLLIMSSITLWLVDLVRRINPLICWFGWRFDQSFLSLVQFKRLRPIFLLIKEITWWLVINQNYWSNKFGI